MTATRGAFFEEQARNRRAACRLTVASGASVVLMEYPSAFALLGVIKTATVG